MDSAHHSDSRRRHDALRCASARDRWDFSKNADSDTSQPRTRWPCATYSASGCAAESRIFAYEVGTHVNRAVTGTLSLVGKASRGASGEPCAGQTNGHGVMEYWSAGLVTSHYGITPLLHRWGF